jgi:hypothetical protein
MNSSKFKRPKKNVDSFVSGGVEIEDVHTARAEPAAEREPSVRMQIYITQSQREWLRRRAYEEDSKMSNILRALIDQAMSEEG